MIRPDGCEVFVTRTEQGFKSALLAPDGHFVINDEPFFATFDEAEKDGVESELPELERLFDLGDYLDDDGTLKSSKQSGA